MVIAVASMFMKVNKSGDGGCICPEVLPQVSVFKFQDDDETKSVK